MGNCGTKPKTSDGDDAPAPPIEPQTAAPGAAEGERKDEEVPAPEPEGTTSQAVVAPQSEEATTTAVEEKEQADEPKEEGAAEEDSTDHGKEKETPPEVAELPASTPASVA